MEWVEVDLNFVCGANDVANDDDKSLDTILAIGVDFMKMSF